MRLGSCSGRAGAELQFPWREEDASDDFGEAVGRCFGQFSSNRLSSNMEITSVSNTLSSVMENP